LLCCLRHTKAHADNEQERMCCHTTFIDKHVPKATRSPFDPQHGSRSFFLLHSCLSVFVDHSTTHRLKAAVVSETPHYSPRLWVLAPALSVRPGSTLTPAPCRGNPIVFSLSSLTHSLPHHHTHTHTHRHHKSARRGLVDERYYTLRDKTAAGVSACIVLPIAPTPLAT